MNAQGATRRPSLARYAVAYALRALVVAAILPVWKAYYFGAWEISGESTWLLISLDSFLQARGQESSAVLWKFYGPELVKLVLFLIAGVAIGVYKAPRGTKSL